MCTQSFVWNSFPELFLDPLFKTSRLFPRKNAFRNQAGIPHQNFPSNTSICPHIHGTTYWYARPKRWLKVMHQFPGTIGTGVHTTTPNLLPFRLGKPKITHSQPRSLDQNVPCLKVSMHNLVPCQVHQCKEKPRLVGADICFGLCFGLPSLGLFTLK